MAQTHRTSVKLTMPSQQYPTLYGGFLHPDSRGSDIYFTMTQYDRYNVSLMHASLPTNEKNNTQAP